jgi:peptide chain release factor subunit 1
MAKTSSGVETPLRHELDKLAAFEPQDSPVVSLYLNLLPDQHGRDHYETFCRKIFAERLKGFREHSAERASFDRDVARINEYLANKLDRSSNGAAIFASSGAGEFFKAIQLDVPLDEHWLFIGPVPHIYPLARLVDQYPRYVSVLLDSNRARIFVFGLGAVEKDAQVQSVKTRKTSMGGWSQARYQRHVENFHAHHVKEVVDTLDRIVAADNIQHVIVVGDETVVALLKDALPGHLSEKIIDILRFDRQAVVDEIAEVTLEVLRQKDAETDIERVAQVIGAWQAGGLAVAGPEASMRALQMGQVEELLITAAPRELKRVQHLPDDAAPVLATADTSAPEGADEQQLRLADELVTHARNTAARVRIIEDPRLLRDYGGVAAMLRFRI